MPLGKRHGVRVGLGNVEKHRLAGHAGDEGGVQRLGQIGAVGEQRADLVPVTTRANHAVAREHAIRHHGASLRPRLRQPSFEKSRSSRPEQSRVIVRYPVEGHVRERDDAVGRRASADALVSFVATGQRETCAPVVRLLLHNTIEADDPLAQSRHAGVPKGDSKPPAPVRGPNDVEAEEPLLTTFKEIAAALDGYWIEIDADQRAAYHVAIELPSLFVMLNLRLAVNMFNAMNIETEDAVRVLLPLLRATAKNFEAFKTSKALTGPVDRGDNETIKRHIDGLRRIYPRMLPLYRQLALQNIPFAMEHGSIDEKKAEELEAILKEYQA